MRIEGSGTRASSLLDRSERDATPCLLIMLVCGAFCRRPATLLGTWRPRRNSPRIPVSECLVRLVLVRQRAVDGS